MTHTLITPQVQPRGYQSGCTCGYRTKTYASLPRAESHAASHIRTTVEPLTRRERPPITIDQATASFLTLLLRGLDENVTAVRGGWPL